MNDREKKILIYVGFLQFILLFFVKNYFIIFGIGAFIIYAIIKDKYKDELLLNAFLGSVMSGFGAFLLFSVVNYLI
jgi:hypothetical protein